MLLHPYTDKVTRNFPQAAEAVSSKFKPPNKLEFEKVQPPTPAPNSSSRNKLEFEKVQPPAPCTLHPAPCTLHPTP